MIMFATKVSVKKVAVGLVALCAVVCGIVALSPKSADSVLVQTTNTVAQKLKTEADRTAYLRAFGWEVQDKALAEMPVQIPKEFDETYRTYNELQKQQGLDLEKYKGKQATLYTYALVNYPTGEEGVVASIVLYRDRVIAVDISSSQADGFMHGVTQPAET